MGILLGWENWYRGELCVPNQGFNAFLLTGRIADCYGSEQYIQFFPELPLSCHITFSTGLSWQTPSSSILWIHEGLHMLLEKSQEMGKLFQYSKCILVLETKISKFWEKGKWWSILFILILGKESQKHFCIFGNTL